MSSYGRRSVDAYLCLLFSDGSMPVAGDKGGDNRADRGVMVKDLKVESAMGN